MAVAVPLSGRRVPPPAQRALEPLIAHARRLMPIDGITFLGVDEARTRVEPLAGWFRDPELEAVLEPSHRRPYNRLRPGPPEIVLERDRPLFLPRMEDWEAAPMLLDQARASLGVEAADRIWAMYSAASLVCVPITGRHGRQEGVLLAAGLDLEQPLTRRDLDFSRVLADLAATVLERSSVAEAETRRAREEQMLKHAAEDVSASLELEVIVSRIAEHAKRLSGATDAGVTFLADGSGERAAIGLSSLRVPLELGPRRFGALSVSHPQPGRMGDEELALLVQLARVSAVAIANSIDFQHERRLTSALTLGFVPQSLPEVAGFEVGLAYEPAAGQPVGGDVYGAWTLSSGEVAMLVGDVAGKGVEKAALASMVRFFIEARAWDEADPAEVLEQANTMLTGRLGDESFVTAFLAYISPDGLRYAGAGHLAPLHLGRDVGSASLEAPGLPLGVEASCRAHTEHVALCPGDLVFAYTDGLLEARRDGEILGIERLRDIVVRLAGRVDTAGLPRAVHEEVSAWAGGLADDAVGLALRRTPS
jgi:Stage II sporulation protein E (SpoIIE)